MDLHTIGDIRMSARQERQKAPNAEHAAVISRAEEFMGVFANVDHAMPSSYIRMFLRVAREPGKGISEYANDLGMYQAIGSRILLEIGPKARSGGEGLGLVEAESHPSDMRSKRYYLTRKGQRLFKQILTVFGVEDIP